jgi:hypothetical protein
MAMPKMTWLCLIAPQYKILTYLHVGNRYEYAPEYESLFPVEVTQWLLLRDLNCDGKKDLFTSDPFGMVAFH